MIHLPSHLQALKLMVANRSEIALRIINSATLFSSPKSPASFQTLALHTPSEANALHVQAASHSAVLPGEGPSQFLDIDSLVSIAKQNGVWGIHPGYGLLSENPNFARAVQDSGMVWIGPTPEQLELFGEKTRARDLARSLGVPLLPGTNDISLSEFKKFVQSQPKDVKLLLKAVSGGGGRGMRIVNSSQPFSELEAAFNECSREAKGAFKDSRIYVERFLEKARHIEVQLIGDGSGDVNHLFERECTLQRSHQKLVEMSPSPSISSSLREKIIQSALRMGRKGKLRSLATVEFLVFGDEFVFLEINPRIQVEYSVTEQITGFDLIQLQLKIALGATLSDLDLSSSQPPLPFPTLTSIQFRLNSESYNPEGQTFSESGELRTFHIPNGKGIRVDTAAHSPFRVGIKEQRYSSNPAFDSLLAKIIFTSNDYESCLRLARKTLSEVRTNGCKTNQFFLQTLAEDPNVRSNQEVHTNFVSENFASLFERSEKVRRRREEREGSLEGDSNKEESKETVARPEGSKEFTLPMGAVLTSCLLEGESFEKGQEVAVIEAMKMEHVLRATENGKVVKNVLNKGQFGNPGSPLFYYESNSISDSSSSSSQDETFDPTDSKNFDLDEIRPELKSLIRSKHLATDEFRKKAVEKRKSKGFLTARENLSLLVDDLNSFIEFGDLVLAAQRSRISDTRLRETTTGDGVITGFGTINRSLFKVSHQVPSPNRVGICVYDYLVLAGTQGWFHHLKLDRLFKNVLDQRCPIVLYAEGGGGRPGDVDGQLLQVGGLWTPSFVLMGHIRAAGLPSIGVANGYTFAGNTALLGTCDIVISTQGGSGKNPGQTSIGMSGPSIIEGAKMGIFTAEEIGPPSVHLRNGNIDVLVPTEIEAALAVKTLLSYFQGPTPTLHSTNSSDQRILRHLIPKDRKRAYDVKEIIKTFSDDGSFIELGPGYGHSVITGFLRVDGSPLAVVASSVISPLGGAIDATSALKATRFMNMLTRTKPCHLVVLADTPGFNVGPEAEKEGPPGQVKAFGEWFASAAAFDQAGGRIFALTLRKAYGLGAQAMLGGSTFSNFFSCAWPTGEFAGMGPEGAVRLAMKKELEAIPDEVEREETYKSFVEAVYERGRAENTASVLEIDTAIDPKDTRKWILSGLQMVPSMIPTWKQPAKGRL